MVLVPTLLAALAGVAGAEPVTASAQARRFCADAAAVPFELQNVSDEALWVSMSVEMYVPPPAGSRRPGQWLIAHEDLLREEPISPNKAAVALGLAPGESRRVAWNLAARRTSPVGPGDYRIVAHVGATGAGGGASFVVLRFQLGSCPR